MVFADGKNWQYCNRIQDSFQCFRRLFPRRQAGAVFRGRYAAGEALRKPEESAFPQLQSKLLHAERSGNGFLPLYRGLTVARHDPDGKHRTCGRGRKHEQTESKAVSPIGGWSRHSPLFSLTKHENPKETGRSGCGQQRNALFPLGGFPSEKTKRYEAACSPSAPSRESFPAGQDQARRRVPAGRPIDASDVSFGLTAKDEAPLRPITVYSIPFSR